jgi:hypothetical protein
MRSLSRVACLACGSDVLVAVAAVPAVDGQLEVDITVGHVGPMDAACRWAAETYGDEVAELWARRRLPES